MKRRYLLTIAMAGIMACSAMTGCGSAADTSEDTVETVSETVADIVEETQTESETVTEVEETTVEDIELPYAEQEELKFSDLSPLEIPFVTYWGDEDDEANNGFELIQGNATYTLGDITASEPDEDGNVTYTFPYTLNMDLVVGGDVSMGGFGSVGFSWKLFDMMDYYTGIKFPGKDLTEDESFDYFTDVEWDGVTYSVGYSKSQEIDYGDWKVEGNTAALPATVNLTITIKAPADYDGIVLAINRNGLTEKDVADDEISEAEPFEVDEGSTIDDYTFIRVSDYVTQ